MNSTVDHVVVCMPDLGISVKRFETDHGVLSVPGGRHRGHGTENRLVPLGKTYIELVTVVDEAEAADSALGRWVGNGASGADAAHAVALRTDDLDEVSRRLGLHPVAMSRKSASGAQLHWRLAGLEEMIDMGVPFFIEWNIDPELHPGRIPITHPAGEVRLGELVVTGDVEKLAHWTPKPSGVEYQAGKPGVSFLLTPRR